MVDRKNIRTSQNGREITQSGIVRLKNGIVRLKKGILDLKKAIVYFDCTLEKEHSVFEKGHT
jgi:hypothetical protein